MNATTPDEFLAAPIPDAPVEDKPDRLTLADGESVEVVPSGPDALALADTDHSTLLQAYDADADEWVDCLYVGVTANEKVCVQLYATSIYDPRNQPVYITVLEDMVRLAPAAVDSGSILFELIAGDGESVLLVVDADTEERAYTLAINYAFTELGFDTLTSITVQ